MIGTPPWIGRTGMLSRALRPAETRSSQFLVVRRDTAALRLVVVSIVIAMAALVGSEWFARRATKRLHGN